MSPIVMQGVNLFLRGPLNFKKPEGFKFYLKNAHQSSPLILFTYFSFPPFGLTLNQKKSLYIPQLV